MPQSLLNDPSQMQPRDMRVRRPTQAVTQAPGLTSSDEGYTRQVQDNELAATHLTQGLEQGGRYVTSARGRGARYAASRGMANSSLAAAGAESAAIDSYLPVALQDAQAYSTAAGQNLDSLSSQRMADEQNSTTRYTSDNSVGAQLRIAERNSEDRRFDREHESTQNQLDRDWRTGERTGDQEFRSTEAERDRNYGTSERMARQRYETASAALDTILSSPEYVRNPEAAAGMIAFYTDFIDNILNSFPGIGGGP